MIRIFFMKSDFFFEIRQFFALHSTESEIFINAGFFLTLGRFIRSSLFYIWRFFLVWSQTIFLDLFSRVDSDDFLDPFFITIFI